MRQKKCDICKTGTISYSNEKTMVDADGDTVTLKEVHCSNPTCLINGIELVLKEATEGTPTFKSFIGASRQ